MQISEIKNPSKFIKENPIPIGIFLFAFIVRLIYIIEFKGTPFADCLTVDSLYYSDWAKRIAAGAILPANAFEMTPLYAYLLGLFYKIISTDLFLVRLFQIIVGSVSTVLVYSVTRDILENRWWGLGAGFVAAIYGPFIFFDAMVMKPFLAVFFVLLMIVFLLRIDRPGLRYAFLAAVALALTALVRENIILLIPVIPLWILKRKDITGKAKKILFFFIGLIIIIAPVTLLNFSATGDFVPITSGGGEVFYIGNSEGADGTYKSPPFVRPNPEYEHEDFRRKAEELTGRKLTRKESSSFWYGQGIKFITSNPTAYMDLSVRKFMLFWNFYEHADNQNYYFHRTHSTLLGLPVLHFGVIAPFGFLGLCLAIRRFKKFSLLFWILLVYMASVLLVFNFARFRLPAIPILIVFAVFSVYWFVEKAKEKKFVYMGIAIYCLVIFFIVANYDYLGPASGGPYKNKFDVAYTSLGICNVDAGKLDASVANFEDALEITPTYTPALVGLGTAYLRGGDPKAYDTFKKAVETGPASPYAHNGLAESLLIKNDYRGAALEFKKAIALDPYDPLFLTNLGYVYNSTGAYDKAYKTYTKAIALDPSYLDTYFGIAIAYAGLGKTPEAIKNIKTFIQYAPDGEQKTSAQEFLFTIQK
ncbi:MAG: tetratricopeptide repeat protein [Thermodesulfobacteriota bacterium]